MTKKRWSHEVTKHETSAAARLPEGLFTKSAEEIAKGLQTAVSERYRVEGLESSGEYRSAMSMIDFYINRAGKNLSDEDRKRLEAAKAELQKLYARA